MNAQYLTRVEYSSTATPVVSKVISAPSPIGLTLESSEFSSSFYLRSFLE